MTGAGPDAGTRTGRGSAQTGVRAFVAREGALIASALDRAARAMRTSRRCRREALHAVLRRMQPLRGLAELSELAPLPEILDGVELAVGRPRPLLCAAGQGARHGGVGGACAEPHLPRRHRDGQPTADAPEARHFADLLRRDARRRRDVVPIESLLADGEPAAPGARAAAPPLGAVELVSHGEHLAQVADRIAGARSRHRARPPPLRAAGARCARWQSGAIEPRLPVSDWALAGARARIASGDATATASDFAGQLRRVATCSAAPATPPRPGANWAAAVGGRYWRPSGVAAARA